MAALEKSPPTLENRCRHLCHYFTFLEQASLQWHQATPDGPRAVCAMAVQPAPAGGAATYGHPLSRDAVKGLFRYYSRKSGIFVRAHMLRHTHATELIKAGWDASYVQKRLGHAQVQTTINTYVHLDEEAPSHKWRQYQQEQSHDQRSARASGTSSALRNWPIGMRSML